MIENIVVGLVSVAVMLGLLRLLLRGCSEPVEPSRQMLGPLQLAALEHECLAERPAEAWGHPKLCFKCYPVHKRSSTDRRGVIVPDGWEVREIHAWGRREPVRVIHGSEA